VPIIYPRMSIAENVLSSKFNPLNLVAKLSPGHLAGYTNKVGQKGSFCAGNLSIRQLTLPSLATNSLTRTSSC